MNSGSSVPNLALPEAAIHVGIWMHCVQLTLLLCRLCWQLPKPILLFFGSLFRNV